MNDPYFLDLLLKHDFILLCGTWTSILSDIRLSGFQEFAVHRKRRGHARNSGGVILYVENDFFPGVQLLAKGTSEIIWIKLSKQFFGFQRDVILCLCYIIPDNSSGQTRVNFDLLDQMMLNMTKLNDEYDNPDFLIYAEIWMVARVPC